MVEYLRLEYIFSEEYLLSNINLMAFQGEILGIVAQRHTSRRGLVRILSGDIKPDAGNIWINGINTNLHSRLDAKKKGIGCVSSTSQLVKNMTVAENIFVNREGSYFSKLHSSNIYINEANKILREVGIHDIHGSIRVLHLSQAEQHIAEIVKGISQRANILIIDHITEQYNREEMIRLINLFNLIRERGISIVFFTNKYSQLFSVADRFYIIRDGTTAAHISHGSITKEELYHYMAQMPFKPQPLSDHSSSDVIMKVVKLQTRQNGPVINFHVERGKILGILESDWEFGVELGNALYGRCSYIGEILVDNKPVKITSPRKALKYGIGLVMENTLGQSVIGNMNLLDNVTLMLNRRYDHRYGLLNTNIRRYKMRDALCKLSGKDILDKYENLKQIGYVNRINQMKIVLAKWLCFSPKIIVMLNPHLGFDEVSILEFEKMLRVLTKNSITIIIITSHMDHITSMCDCVISTRDN